MSISRKILVTAAGVGCRRWLRRARSGDGNGLRAAHGFKGHKQITRAVPLVGAVFFGNISGLDR